MPRSRPFEPTQGHYASNPSRCDWCDLAAPYWRDFPARASWWFGKDGAVRCPAHVPDWVADWRAAQGKRC